MFTQNICLLLFLLLIGVVALFLILAGWTGMNVFRWRSEQRRESADARRTLFDTAGRPLPPFGRGLCEKCERADDRILHLPNGRRLCRACYDQENSPPSE